ncbi:hypothetical protein OH146_04460 [Salinibacterium sp. SYSU T00001]|uniref:hypothetical protein n=1 Tax=Homoserinimonas sedimenticola TaxID=2986805 RepID=UPI0022366EE1|nr:hypothetical protein [Salinibacterium sedimenticola]MCW4385023.1 hypothetical protein [Salinibacterium sedimenticola]
MRRRLRQGHDHLRESWFALLVAALVIASAAATLAGFPLWPLFAAAALPWGVAVSSRVGAFAAVMGSLLATMWLIVGVLMVTPLLPATMHVSVTIAWTLFGLAGAAVMLGRNVAPARPRPVTLVTWLPAALGGAFWIALTLVSAQLPGASRLSLVVHGDSANNVLFARQVLYHSGIAVGPEENPVPMPSALLALAMAPGRDAVAPADLLRHDLTAFTGVWAMVIAGVCLLTGVVAAAVTERAGAGLVMVGAVGAVASFVPLTWFVTGYPLEFGFFNAHIALVVVLASFAAYLVEEKSPAHALALLCVTATLLLTVWSPFVLLPASLAVVLVLRHRRSLLRVRRLSLFLVLASGMQLIVYGLAVVLPSFIALSDFLSAFGGAHSVPRWVFFAILVATLVLALLAFRTPRHPIVYGLLALATGSILGLAVLLFMSRHQPTPWTYYPLKYFWLITVVLLLLSLGVVAGAIVHRVPRGPLRAAALAVAAASLVFFLYWIPRPITGGAEAGPVLSTLRGEFLGHGDDVVNTITSLSDPEQPHLLWRSGELHEVTVNFWIMQMWADSLTEHPELRVAAYGGYDTGKAEDLCTIVDLMGGGTIVHTSDESLEAEVDATCPQLGVAVTPY